MAPNTAVRLLTPLLTFLATLGAYELWLRLDGDARLGSAIMIDRLLLAAVWLAGAWLVTRLIDRLLWRGLFRREGSRAPPRLVSDLVAGLVWMVVILAILGAVFQVPLAAIITTSGVAVAIIGFALRDMLASLFAGVALSLERPYRLGDWIEGQPGQLGRVDEIGWLTTRAITREGVTLVIPNSQLATRPFRNYSQPRPGWWDRVAVTIDHAVPADRVERLLRAAAASVAEIAADPDPVEIAIAEFGARGIVWEVWFNVADPDRQGTVRYALQRAILRHLHQAGIALPYTTMDVFAARMPTRTLAYDADLDRLIARCELFSALPAVDRAALAQAARLRRLGVGEVLLHEGEASTSLYLVLEGVLDVHSTDRRHDSIGPGETVGEFALLTGEPRSATVTARTDALVAELTRSDLEPLFERNHALPEALARILAERRRRGEAIERAKAPDGGEAERLSILEKVRRAFGL